MSAHRGYLCAVFALFLALQFVPGVGVRDAQASCSPRGGGGYTCSFRDEAYSTALAASRAGAQSTCASKGGVGASSFVYFSGNTFVRSNTYCVQNPATLAAQAGPYYWNSSCPAGAVWDNASQSCFSAAACLAHNAEPGFMGVGDVTRPFEQACIGGCQYQVQSPYSMVAAGSAKVVNGTFEFTGNACPATVPKLSDPTVSEPPPPLTDAQAQNPPSSECMAVEGQTMCVKRDGRHCYPASNGRNICWRPGEVGEKVDGPILQKRVGGAGVSVGTPGTTPPYGAMYEPAENGVEIMAQYGWFRNEGGSSTPTQQGEITTTTKNFKTSTNVNAGGAAPDEGENADGTPGPSAGNKGPGGTPGGTGNVLDVSGMPLTPAAGPADSSGVWGGTGEGSGLDLAGFLGTRTCPPPPTFTIAGMTRTIDTSGLCDGGAIIAALVLLMALAHAAWIIGES